MGRILKYGDFIGEGYLTKITREYFGEGDERLEDGTDLSGLPDKVEVVRFTDRNGVFHRNGLRVSNGSRRVLAELLWVLMDRRGPDCDLNDIDVSNVRDMSSLFYRSRFNGDVSGWDVSGVRDMGRMFGASDFNGDVSKWDVGNVRNMDSMFAWSDFSGDVSGWKVRGDCSTELMFEGSPLEGREPAWYRK